MSSNLLLTAAAGSRAAAGVGVDEHERGLLIRRTIRTPIMVHEETRKVQTIVRGDGDGGESVNLRWEKEILGRGAL